MRTIGERLRDARGAESRDIFSPKCGVSRSTLANYETGISDPPHGFLVKILELRQNINPLWLFIGEGPMERPADPQPANAAKSLDLSLLEDILAAVEEHLCKGQLRLAPDKKAKLITILYDMFAGKGDKKVDKAVVVSLFELAA